MKIIFQKFILSVIALTVFCCKTSVQDDVLTTESVYVRVADHATSYVVYSDTIKFMLDTTWKAVETYDDFSVTIFMNCSRDSLVVFGDTARIYRSNEAWDSLNSFACLTSTYDAYDVATSSYLGTWDENGLLSLDAPVTNPNIAVHGDTLVWHMTAFYADYTTLPPDTLRTWFAQYGTMDNLDSMKTEAAKLPALQREAFYGVYQHEFIYVKKAN